MCKNHEFPNLLEFKNAQFESAEIKLSHDATQWLFCKVPDTVLRVIAGATSSNNETHKRENSIQVTTYCKYWRRGYVML